MTTIKSTNWSTPKTNFFSAILDLRKALANGYKARLIREYNGNCKFPIKEKKVDKDFRNYERSVGFASTVKKIKEDPNANEFDKHLSLNYVNVFGSKEAVKRYYETGVLGKDNFKGIGRSHLVHVDDLIKHLRDTKQYDRANMYERQYRAPEHGNETSHLFDFFHYKHGSPYAVKQFKRKLWVVELLKNDADIKVPFIIKVLNVILYPLKFIPQKSVLNMKEYKEVTYRIGSVTNGYSVKIQIPKKFSF